MMRNLNTEILIIGGGATGTGIVRDLSMRGFKTILIDQNDLATGTTGRHHGLLHSGGRYVVKDPFAARECIEENRILRRIMPECIEDTGGFFTLTPGDNPDYAHVFVDGCRKAGIPCEEISIMDMLRKEPLLNPAITRCFQVPDASADSFMSTDLNAESARQYGAVILRYHRLISLMTNQGEIKQTATSPGIKKADRVYGAVCHDLIQDEDIHIDADLVINASGAWAGKIAATAGIQIIMTPGKGVLLAINHRIVNTVINRCKIPGDGDIIVPTHTVSIIGTTDVKVADPDRIGIEPWEIQLMLDEGEKTIPGFHNLRFLRAWAGVRPLYQESMPVNPINPGANRDITRAFVLLDHAERDGVDGFITITSGKWTTYRKMAEVTADKACQKLGVIRQCRTHLESLPSPDKKEHGKYQHNSQNYYHLNHRLYRIERAQIYGQLICECELATLDDVKETIIGGKAQTLDDIRRDIRLGMGPCQAGFCTIRAAGLMNHLVHKEHHQIDQEVPLDSQTSDQPPEVYKTNIAVRNFLQERWKGVRSILWGQQLRQERLNELIYLNVLNADRLPGPSTSHLSPASYTQGNYKEDRRTENEEQLGNSGGQSFTSGLTKSQPDILVIGGGLAGLTVAFHGSAKGKKVKLVTKGWGATHWASGCIDVLSENPRNNVKEIIPLLGRIETFINTHPEHPYAILGISNIDMAIRYYRDTLTEAGYTLQGSLETNWQLPTALGTIRETCLAPSTMVAGNIIRQEPILLVGFEKYLDFYPGMVAANLRAQKIDASGILLDLPSVKKHRFITSMILARMFDDPEFREEFILAIKPKLKKSTRLGLPAVLGLQKSLEALSDIETQLGCEIFEIPGLPPSVPGIRIHNLLSGLIRRNGGQIFDGMQVVNAVNHGATLTEVLTETSTKQVSHPAKAFVLATGGILGGGITIDPPGYTQNRLRETTLGLSIQPPIDTPNWFEQSFLDGQGHPIFKVGITVNNQFQPIDKNGKSYYANLYTVGGLLDKCDPIREKSLEGLAIVTAWAVAEQLTNPAIPDRQAA